jgi:WD40 repeat protein
LRLGGDLWDLSPDGKLLVAGKGHGAQIWDVSTGTRIRDLRPALPIPGGGSLDDEPIPESYPYGYWSSEGGKIAGLSAQGVNIWNAHDGTLLRSIPCEGIQRFILGSLAWRPDGKAICALTRDALNVYDAESGQLLNRIRHGSGSTELIGWTENGRLLAWSVRGSVRLSSLDSEVPVRELTFLDSNLPVRDLKLGCGCVSPDGRYLASFNLVNPGNSIQLRSLEDGRHLCTLLVLRDDQYAFITPEGHWAGTPGIEKELVYVVQTNEQQEVLTPEEFAKRFGWKNNPDKAMATAEGGRARPESGGQKPEGKSPAGSTTKTRTSTQPAR